MDRIKKTLKNKDFTFFCKSCELFVKVKLPNYKTIYMGLGNNNQPFDDIITNIRLAYETLDENVENGPSKNIIIAHELPRVLGYKRSNADLN